MCQRYTTLQDKDFLNLVIFRLWRLITSFGKIIWFTTELAKYIQSNFSYMFRNNRTAHFYLIFVPIMRNWFLVSNSHPNETMLSILDFWSFLGDFLLMYFYLCIRGHILKRCRKHSNFRLFEQIKPRTKSSAIGLNNISLQEFIFEYDK